MKKIEKTGHYLAIDELKCGDEFDEADFDNRLEMLLNELNNFDGFDSQKIVMISFCDSQDDHSCGVNSRLHGGNIEINVINILGGEQFSCLVNSGSTSSPNYNSYDTFNDATNDSTNIETEICELPTPAPTPISTPAPTDNPTPAPTDNPTADPTDDTTPVPTDNPTSAPTPSPTDNPTPVPTDNPTGSPTSDPCNLFHTQDVVYVLSNGCGLTSSECDMMRGYMAELIEETFNPFYSQVHVIPHDLTGDGVLSGSREYLISAMNTLSCNIDGNDETNYDGEYGIALEALVSGSAASAKKSGNDFIL